MRETTVAVTRVVDVMSTEVNMLPVDSFIAQARSEMLDTPGSALPIVDGAGKPLGIVTKSDLVAAGADGLPIAVIMSHPVLTCTADDLLRDVAETMRRHVVHHLVVVDEDGIVVGMVSIFDLLAMIT